MAHRFVAKSRLSAGENRVGVRDPGSDTGLPRSRRSAAASGAGASASSDVDPRAVGHIPGNAAKSARPGESPRVGALCSAKRARLSVSDASLQPTPLDSRISLEVSKAITAFARYPHKRPAGLRPDVDGSLDINEVWSLWGRFHGVTKHHMLQFIAEHAFNAAGHRRFLLRSDHEGRTWVSVAQSLRRFSQRRHHRDRRAAPRTLDAGERDFEADAAAPRTLDAGARDFEADAATPRTLDAGARNFEADVVAPRTVDSGARDFEAAAVAPRTLDAGARDFVADAVAPRTLDSGTRDFEADAISISSDSTLGTTEVKAEPFLDPTVPPTLLCKEEVSATSPVSRSCDPAPDVPGLLDGFSFLFTETDNFGCPVVTGDDELSPLSDTIPHTVPDSFSDTLEGMHVDTLLTADMESSGISDIDVPCPGQPALVHRFPGVSRSLAEPRDKPIPPAIPQFHSHPPSTPHDDGHPISTPPAPRWFLKVTLDQDTRRLPFLCSGTPSFHDVLTGVCTLFHLTPFDPAASPILSYRDLDGDTCTLTNTTYHDALPLFAATRIIRLSLAATHLAVTRPSTLSPDATPPFPGHLPSHTSRYSPPAHAVAGLSRDQLFLRQSYRKEHDHAIAQWKSQHRDNPCSMPALHSLREIFPTDSTGGLAVLRTCLPRHTPDSRNQASTTSVLPPPRQCSVPGAWSADEILSAAKWILGSPGLVWSPTPGAGGHKQIRIKNAVINHWNSGVVNVQGRDAHLVSEKLLSTRQLTDHHSPVPDSGWLPISRRRKRLPPSPAARIPSTDCRSPPAPPPFTPSPHRIPPELSRFSALSSHDLELPDPPPPLLFPSSAPVLKPTTTQHRSASSYACEKRFAHGNLQSDSFTYSGQRLGGWKLVFPYLCLSL